VITYPAKDVHALASALEDVVSRRTEIAASLKPPATRDTLAEEAELLTLQGAGHGFKGAEAEKAEKALIAFFEAHLKLAPK
jgi:hypothetical protein